MSRNKSGMFAPAEDGGPGNYGNQRQRKLGVSAIHAPVTDGGSGNYGNQRHRKLGVGFYAPATDGGSGNVGNQRRRKKLINKNYTKDSLDRSMRGNSKSKGCAYLSNGEKCICSEGRIRVNDHYRCCRNHASCFENWTESKKNEYN
jgi:hypothetical protein